MEGFTPKSWMFGISRNPEGLAPWALFPPGPTPGPQCPTLSRGVLPSWLVTFRLMNLDLVIDLPHLAQRAVEGTVIKRVPESVCHGPKRVRLAASDHPGQGKKESSHLLSTKCLLTTMLGVCNTGAHQTHTASLGRTSSYA